MRQVEVTADLRASREAVLAALDPASLIRLEGTFDIESVRDVDDGWLVTCVTEVNDETVRKTMSVDAVDDGFAYELVDGGFFEELHTTILVRKSPTESEADDYDGPLTRVSIRSTYTFGGRFARVKDWLAASERRTELRRVIARLAAELADEEIDSTGSPDGPELETSDRSEP